MKATLEFDLDDRNDARAHMRCVKSEDMAIVLFDLRELLIKSDDTKITGEEFSEVLESRGIILSELII